jgi:hypothetical protein
MANKWEEESEKVDVHSERHEHYGRWTNHAYERADERKMGGKDEQRRATNKTLAYLMSAIDFTIPLLAKVVQGSDSDQARSSAVELVKLVKGRIAHSSTSGCQWLA